MSPRLAFAPASVRLFVGCVLVCALGVPSVAHAQPVPGGLQGESFFASAFVTEGIGNPGQGGQPQECDPDGTSTVRFEVTGAAAGPYPGTFTETGTVTIGAQTLDQENVIGTQQAGLVVTFTADFSIVSGTTTVTGTKTLSATFSGQQYESVGACASFENSTELGILDPSFYATISGRSYMADVSSSYEATITTATGTIHDTGDAITFFNEGYFTGGTCAPQPTTCEPNQIAGSAGGNGFAEVFASIDRGSAPEAVVLSPPTAINAVGTTHTVTATATTGSGTPATGATVLFTVTGSVTTTGQCTTNNAGQCNFTYQGPNIPGADLITGCADANRNGDIDPGEPCGEAMKVWVLPATTPGQVTGGGWIVREGEGSSGKKISFGFNAKSRNVGDTPRGNCNVIDHASKTHIKCLTVDSLVISLTHATFSGEATVDGVRTRYRIDVDDLGEPGVADTFKIQTDSGYAAVGTLRGGNVQIHK